MASLNSLAQNDYQPDVAFTVELVGIDGTPLFNDDDSRMTIDVLGADSDVAVKARNQNSNRRMQQGSRVKITAEVLQADEAAYLAKLTTGWNIQLEDGKEKTPFSREEVVRLYSNPKLAFIKEQVDMAIAERANFLKR